ncbi:MAG: hypothetical protein ABIG10_00900 [bacterium]
MIITKKNITFCLLCFAILFGTAAHAERCDEAAEVTITIRDADNQFIPDARFSIYEQLEDVDKNKTIGDSIGSASIDEYIGSGTAKVYPDTEVDYYVLKVNNPSGVKFDFWFLDAMYLYCGKETSFTKYLSAIKVALTNSQGQLEKNSKFTIYTQTTDALGNPMVLESLGGFNTGEQGEKVVYLPSHNTMLVNPIDYYVIEFKNSSGQKFYKYNINTVDKKVKPIIYAFSDLIVTLNDSNTGEVIPNAKLALYEQIIGPYGTYEPGKSLASMKTDDKGQAYLQYPAGVYLIQYKHTNNELTNFTNIVINDQTRTSKSFLLKTSGKDTGRCDSKTELELSFRNADSQIIPDLNFSLYEQEMDNDNRPIHGNRVSSGKVDDDGIGKMLFYPTPAKRYVLEVCDEISKFGCFEFNNLEFECSDKIFFERQLNQVDVILRDINRELKLNHLFKIYSRITDVDGKQIIDKTKGEGSFKMPDSGIFTLYLADKDLQGNTVGYTIMVPSDSGQELYKDFDINTYGKTHLEYVINPDGLLWLKPREDPLVNSVFGKILLQVEEHGEAWYVNPADRKRYYLGRPEDAFSVMKKLSVGASNFDLSKIPVSLDIMPAGSDTDNDSLPDMLEKGLLTNWQQADTDGDSYSDFEEIKNGYNPLGSGRLIHDLGFAREQRGRILLQVEGNGEAWYISPLSYRYYLSRPNDAFSIMRELGLGITNANLSKIQVGQINF